ncbi:MAG: prepilin peptidase [Acidimicrobiales bacterium]|nr:prepilin peptidase [Acidimicrobiales bacterium]
MASALATREPLAIAVPEARRGLRPGSRRTLGCSVAHALLWAAAGWRWGASPETVAFLALFSMLLVVSVIDIEHSRIPDRISLPSMFVAAVVVVIASLVGGDGPRLFAALLGAGLFFGGLGLAHLLSPRGMGRGDVKLSVVLGLALGWVSGRPSDAVLLVLVAFFGASVAGTGVGLVLLVRRRRNAPYPFGPSLVAGTVAVLLLAEQVVAR